jgi:hypothetical protein
MKKISPKAEEQNKRLARRDILKAAALNAGAMALVGAGMQSLTNTSGARTAAWNCKRAGF